MFLIILIGFNSTEKDKLAPTIEQNNLFQLVYLLEYYHIHNNGVREIYIHMNHNSKSYIITTTKSYQ